MINIDIDEIEKALRLHSSYSGNYTSSGIGYRGSDYLIRMDQLACGYSGAPSEKLSKLLHNYYDFVGVSNLDEAFQRLRKIDEDEKV